MTLLGVQNAEGCSYVEAERNVGFWALWLKKALFPPLPLLYTSNGELSEEDLAEYSSLVRPYQDEPLAGEDTTVNEDELDADGLSPGILRDRYERAKTSQCHYYTWERLPLCLTCFVCLCSPLRLRSV